MEIEEEVSRKRQTIKVEDPEQAYPEVRDLLINRMSFDHVSEDKYFNDVEEGKIRTKIETTEGYDRYTVELIEIFLTIDKNSRELDLQIKSNLITEYPDHYSYQKTLWYYAYRSLFDKFLYGGVRHAYEPDVEHKTDEILQRIRDAVEG